MAGRTVVGMVAFRTAADTAAADVAALEAGTTARSEGSESNVDTAAVA